MCDISFRGGIKMDVRRFSVWQVDVRCFRTAQSAVAQVTLSYTRPHSSPKTLVTHGPFTYGPGDSLTLTASVFSQGLSGSTRPQSSQNRSPQGLSLHKMTLKATVGCQALVFAFRLLSERVG